MKNYAFIENYDLVVKNIREQSKAYLIQSGVKSVILGVSGGIDSALCLALAYPVCKELNVSIIGRSISIKTNKQEEKQRASLIGNYFCDDFQEVSLDEEFDVVLIDTPAGVSKNVQYWTSSAAEVIMVVTPEPTSLADCYASIKILSQMTLEKSFKLIVNMVKSDIEAKKIYEKISTLSDEYLQVRVEYLGFIPFDEAMRNSIRERIPCVQKYPFSLASQGLRDIARQIVTQGTVGQLKGTMQFFWRKMVSANTPDILGYR
jgi:septum formation inhibitor-activating ATPase MinD